LERHHLFPVAYLKTHGFPSERDYNQIANYAMVEWGENVAISDQPPSAYVPKLESRFDPATRKAMYEHHALPDGWESLQYSEFLLNRRALMAETIRSAYHRLAGSIQLEPHKPPVSALVAAGEGPGIEFKSTLRRNLHTNQTDPKIEFAVLKTVAAFLNTDGGTLVIGVADDGTPVGLEPDGFPSEDKMALHLINLLKERIGGEHALVVHPRFDEHNGTRVFVVECHRSKSPAFVKEGGVERFFVRYGPSTQELVDSSMHDFMKQRF
jgi:hypothetical protein